ncbi:hypothetical protein SNEBB_008497 [Seison nebaliae]|nr:hypothetical protein SNEBB_008497 [Seison nebaliae]
MNSLLNILILLFIGVVKRFSFYDIVLTCDFSDYYCPFCDYDRSGWYIRKKLKSHQHNYVMVHEGNDEGNYLLWNKSSFHIWERSALVFSTLSNYGGGKDNIKITLYKMENYQIIKIENKILINSNGRGWEHHSFRVENGIYVSMKFEFFSSRENNSNTFIAVEDITFVGTIRALDDYLSCFIKKKKLRIENFKYNWRLLDDCSFGRSELVIQALNLYLLECSWSYFNLHRRKSENGCLPYHFHSGNGRHYKKFLISPSIQRKRVDEFQELCLSFLMNTNRAERKKSIQLHLQFVDHKVIHLWNAENVTIGKTEELCLTINLNRQDDFRIIFLYDPIIGDEEFFLNFSICKLTFNNLRKKTTTTRMPRMLQRMIALDNSLSLTESRTTTKIMKRDNEKMINENYRRKLIIITLSRNVCGNLCGYETFGWNLENNLPFLPPDNYALVVKNKQANSLTWNMPDFTNESSTFEIVKKTKLLVEFINTSTVVGTLKVSFSTVETFGDWVTDSPSWNTVEVDVDPGNYSTVTLEYLGENESDNSSSIFGIKRIYLNNLIVDLPTDFEEPCRKEVVNWKENIDWNDLKDCHFNDDAEKLNEHEEKLTCGWTYPVHDLLDLVSGYSNQMKDFGPYSSYSAIVNPKYNYTELLVEDCIFPYNYGNKDYYFCRWKDNNPAVGATCSLQSSLEVKCEKSNFFQFMMDTFQRTNGRVDDITNFLNSPKIHQNEKTIYDISGEFCFAYYYKESRKEQIEIQLIQAYYDSSIDILWSTRDEDNTIMWNRTCLNVSLSEQKDFHLIFRMVLLNESAHLEFFEMVFALDEFKISEKQFTLSEQVTTQSPSPPTTTTTEFQTATFSTTTVTTTTTSGTTTPKTSTKIPTISYIHTTSGDSESTTTNDINSTDFITTTQVTEKVTKKPNDDNSWKIAVGVVVPILLIGIGVGIFFFVRFRSDQNKMKNDDVVKINTQSNQTKPFSSFPMTKIT